MYSFVFPETSGSDVVARLRKGLSVAIAVVLFLFGTPVVLVGLLLLSGNEFVRGGMFAAGIGLFLLSAAFLILLNRQYPEKLIFDNARGLLRIIEQKGGEYGIPYNEILNFHVGIARQKDVSYFTVEMEKNDGAVWTLAIFTGRAKAEEAVAKLQRFVHLQSASSDMPARADERHSLDGINRFEKNGVTVIEWKQRFSLFFRIVGYCAIFSFALVLFSMAGWFLGNVAGYYIALFFALALTIYPAVYFFYSIRRVYVLEIGRGLVRYYTRGFFARGLAFDLSIDRIDAVLFNFSVQRAESVIYFLSSEQKNRLSAIMHGDIGNIMDDVAFMMHLPRIDAGGFTVSEKLKLEGIIQQTMKEHGARENL